MDGENFVTVGDEMLDGCEEVDDRIPVVDILVPQREKERMRDIM